MNILTMSQRHETNTKEENMKLCASLPLRIDYCDERVVYQNGDLSGTKNGHTHSPAFSLSSDIT